MRDPDHALANAVAYARIAMLMLKRDGADPGALARLASAADELEEIARDLCPREERVPA